MTQDSIERLLVDLGLKKNNVLSVEIPDGTEIIDANVNKVEDGVLIDCLKLKNLIISDKIEIKHTAFGVNDNLSQITIIKDLYCKNSNTKKEIEKAIEMKLISKDAKIFYGELEPEIKDEPTHIEKYEPEKDRSYSELICLKALTLIWLIYKFIVITVYKFKHNILKLEDGKQNKSKPEIKKTSKKESLSEKIKFANHKIANEKKNNILKCEQKKSGKIM